MAIPDFQLSSDAEEVVRIISKGTKGPEHDAFLADESCYFAHYTSAETVKNVIESRGVFMRNTRLMNDHSEVRHGFALVRQALESGVGARYLEAWAEIDARVARAIPNVLKSAEEDIAQQCYVLSVCEHREPDDRDGKLSMWRAYGNGELRVAVIAKTTNAMRLVDDGIVVTPVLYGGESEVNEELEYKSNVVFNHRHIFKDLDVTNKVMFAIGILVNFAVSIKHKGFVEEREWRYIYMKSFQTAAMEAQRKSVVLGGVPQIVYKLPISVPADENYAPETQFLKGLILGPCAESETIKDGLVELLRQNGFDDPETYVSASSIPYRLRM
nr:DUF2971 domain-containing protein [Aminobacter aminovorans]